MIFSEKTMKMAMKAVVMRKSFVLHERKQQLLQLKIGIHNSIEDFM